MGSLDIWEHSKVHRIFLDQKCAFVPSSDIANLIIIASKTAKLRGVLMRPTQRAHTIASVSTVNSISNCGKQRIGPEDSLYFRIHRHHRTLETNGN